MKQLVKLIMLNEKWHYLSYDKEIYEIHKFRSKYPSKTFVRIPIKIIDGKIQSLTEETNVDGYVVISKRDYVEYNPKHKQNAKLRMDNCKKLCEDAIKDFNNKQK